MRLPSVALLGLIAIAACSPRGGGEGEAEQRDESGSPSVPSGPVERTDASPDEPDEVGARLGSGPYSTYTRLDLDRCELLERIEEGASAKWRCPGYGGFQLTALTGDGRMDLDAGGDNGTFESLSPFNEIAETVEWRLRPDDTPFAIIYRLRTATPEVKARSVLFIETVPDPGQPACLLGKVEGSIAQANARARQIADDAQGETDCARSAPITLGNTD